MDIPYDVGIDRSQASLAWARYGGILRPTHTADCLAAMKTALGLLKPLAAWQAGCMLAGA
jgi:hypothetical protein